MWAIVGAIVLAYLIIAVGLPLAAVLLGAIVDVITDPLPPTPEPKPSSESYSRGVWNFLAILAVLTLPFVLAALHN